MDLQKAQNDLIKAEKAAQNTIMLKGLSGVKAHVIFVVDISASMSGMYRAGIMNALAVRLMGLALKFSKTGEVPMYAYGAHQHRLGSLDKNNYHRVMEYNDRNYEVSFPCGPKRLESNTYYTGCMSMVYEDLFGRGWENNRASTSMFKRLVNGDSYAHAAKPLDAPVLVVMMTDGDNQDKSAYRKLIKTASGMPVFVQHCAVGYGPFTGLEQIDDMADSERFVDNAGLFTVPSLDIDDQQLMDKLLNEFPIWLKKVQAHSWWA